MKLKNYLAAIDDCEACLQLEPDNVKALLRLADANYAQGRRRESHDIYQRILSLEPQNVIALKALEQLRSQLGEVAPAHATRLIIEELKTDEKPKSKTKAVSKPAPVKEYDLAELVKPNRVVSAAEALGNKFKNSAKPPKENVSATPSMLLLPQDIKVNNPNSNNNKLLIQEL